MIRVLVIISLFCSVFSIRAQFLEGVRQDNFEVNILEKKRIDQIKKDTLVKDLKLKKEILKTKAKISKEELINDKKTENLPVR